MIYIIAILILIVILSFIHSIDKLRQDISLINLKLDKIANHIGITETPDLTLNKSDKLLGISNSVLDDELRSLISKGKKIEAIKRLRMESNLGLKEAKDYVDSLDR